MILSNSIQLFCEDNMKFMARCPDNHFDLGMTDIPYGLDVGNMAFVKEVNTTVKQKNGKRLNPNRKKKMKPSDWDKNTPPQEWFNEFKRITKHQIFFGVEYVNYDGLGPGRIKWNKGFSDEVSFKKYELAYCSFIDYEKEIDYLWAGMMQGKSIHEPMVQQGNKSLNEKRLHITQKPILLWDSIFIFAQSIINIKSVFDSNSGLSSMAISCDKFGYTFTGCDINKEYHELSVNRLNKYLSQQTFKL